MNFKAINQAVKNEIKDFYARLARKGLEALGKRFGEVQDCTHKMIGSLRFLIERYRLSTDAIFSLELEIAADWYDAMIAMENKKHERKAEKTMQHKVDYITCDKPLPCLDDPKPVKTVKSILAKHDSSPQLKPVSKIKEVIQVGAFLTVAAGIGSAFLVPVVSAFSVTGAPLFEHVSLIASLAFSAIVAAIVVIGERG